MSKGFGNSSFGVTSIGQLVRGTDERSLGTFPRQGGGGTPLDDVLPQHAGAGAPVALSTLDAAFSNAPSTSVRPFGMWLRAWGLHAEAALALGAGVAVAVAAPVQPFVQPFTAVAALATWMVGAYHGGRAVTTPLTRQLATVVRSALLPLAVLAAAVGFLGVASSHVPQTFAAMGASVSAAVLLRSFRWRLQAPVRLVVVGDRAVIATETALWARTAAVHVVGGVMIETDLAEEAAPREILGVPTVMGLDAVESRVRHWQADLVVVHPGPGVTAESFRKLSWALEGSRVAVGVSGVLSSVAPHRITPGGLGRSSIMDVRPPRPSHFVRGLKAGFDRLSGVLLLFALSPLLLAIVVAVRLDSKGPALFTQLRVGRGGQTFKLYKVRTMVQGAEHIKAGLSEANEFDAVLFKMKRDPRITRVGGWLRKSSLDELPQLLNVVRGEMSLVGPRPHLPEEVARMDENALRRHAVRPGITGLWQVSGRSDLAWEECAALDSYYADNWSLSGDAVLCLRTIKAVVEAKGAY